eukprot:jgi/Tetstr1/440861/TSEL_003101.t1
MPLPAVDLTAPAGGALTAAALSAAAAAAPLIRLAAPVLLKPRRCAECLGAGFTPCGTCRGVGRAGLLRATAPGGSPPSLAALKATRQPPCQACEGRGRCRCARCKGQGLRNTWLWKPAADPGWGPRGYWEQ